MRKIPTIFLRNPENRKEVLDEPNPMCDWVFKGEGEATRKYDGTSCLIENGKLYKRREIKPWQPIPDNFREADYDQVTGKRVGWVPVDPNNSEDKYHVEAFDPSFGNGTYELCGPKVQGNPENFESHHLIPHNKAPVYPDCPRTFEGLREWLSAKDIEGIVFHHPDGRMAKIKKRDFNLERKP